MPTSTVIPTAVPGDQYLGPRRNDSNLKGKAVKAGTMTIASNAISFVLHLAGTVVLARLISPHDFGLITLATTYSLLLQNFGFNGFVEVIMQREVITHREVSTVFWINLAANLLLTLLFAAAGPLLALLNKEPQLTWVCLGVAASILASSLGTQHLALIQRKMEFGRFSLIYVGSRFVALVGSIGLALAGGGVWALVANVVLLPLSTAAGAWWVCRWRPGRPGPYSEVAGIVRSALQIYGNFMTAYVGRNIDKMLLGWAVGAGSLGQYKRAYDLFVLPVSQLTSPLSSVALAGLSRLCDQPERFRANYLKAVAIFAFAGMGLGGLLTVTGVDVVRFVLGPKWDEAGRIFTFFSPAIGVMLIYSTITWLHLSLGRSDRLFRWGIAEMCVTVAFLAGGLVYGAAGVAIGWTASYCVLIWPGLSYAGAPIGLRVGSVFAAFGKFLLAALGAGLMCHAALHWFDGTSGFLAGLGLLPRLISVSSLYSLAYLLLLLLFPFKTTYLPVLDVLRAAAPRLAGGGKSRATESATQSVSAREPHS